MTTIVLIADTDTGDAAGVVMETCDVHNPASLMEPAGDPHRVAHLN